MAEESKNSQTINPSPRAGETAARLEQSEVTHVIYTIIPLPCVREAWVNVVELRRRHRVIDVTPVKTGVQSDIEKAKSLDSGLRRNDGVKNLVLPVLNSTALRVRVRGKIADPLSPKRTKFEHTIIFENIGCNFSLSFSEINFSA